jgi:uncharacterized membrane protein YhdT
MSFLFHQKTQKAIKWIFGIVAVLIIGSMVLAYAPGIIPGFY